MEVQREEYNVQSTVNLHQIKIQFQCWRNASVKVCKFGNHHKFTYSQRLPHPFFWLDAAEPETMGEA